MAVMAMVTTTTTPLTGLEPGAGTWQEARCPVNQEQEEESGGEEGPPAGGGRREGLLGALIRFRGQP